MTVSALDRCSTKSFSTLCSLILDCVDVAQKEVRLVLHLGSYPYCEDVVDLAASV